MRHPRPAWSLLAAGLALAGCSAARSPEEAPARQLPATAVTTAPPARPAVQESAALAAVRVLHRWDARRAAAYATGSVARLGALYVPGSGAGRADVHRLRRYVARGYRVEGMRMQVLAVEVLAHRRGSWRLRVTDRLQAAVAVGEHDRVVLPHDRATTRVLRLVRGDGGWQVASVRG